MEITTDVMLKGPIWVNTIDKLSVLFPKRANYDVFLLSLAIGIMYDKRIDKFDDEEVEPRSVPRNVLQNQGNDGKLDFMFQAAILSTKTMQLSEDERLKMAFGESDDHNIQENQFNKLGFLVEFANFGVTKLAEKIADNDVDTMENIKDFLTSTVEGYNFDINAIPDDVLLDDNDDLDSENDDGQLW